jgi:hypothetical protein
MKEAILKVIKTRSFLTKLVEGYIIGSVSYQPELNYLYESQLIQLKPLHFHRIFNNSWPTLLEAAGN